MCNYRKIQEVASEITRCSGLIEDYKYRVETLLKNKTPEVHAEVDFQINGPRSAMVIWLNKDEVVAVLRRLIQEKTDWLKELKKEYKKLDK